MIKSLFDVKGNSKFKASYAKKSSNEEESKAKSKSDSDSSSEEEEGNSGKVKPGFMAQSNQKINFTAPFQPKTGVSPIFGTTQSLWNNPFEKKLNEK